MAATGSTGFSINADEGGFKNRCDDIFAGLASLEKKHDAFASNQSRNRTDAERSRFVKPDPREDPVQPQPRARGSFKPPHGRPRHARYTPGFKKDPEKWTSYDLSDVSRDQLSERGNTAAALAFLQERRKAKEPQEDHTPADLSKKVEFSQRSKSDDASDKSESGEKKFRGGKLVMPEYDMGQKKIPVKPKWQRVSKSSAGSSGSSSINLDYLKDSDDEDMEVDCEVISNATRKRKADDSDVKLRVESPEEVTDKDNTESASQISDSSSTDKPEIKFKKVAGKRAIRRRQRDEEDEDE